MRDLIKDFPVNVFNIHENLIEVLLEMQVRFLCGGIGNKA